MPRLPLIPTLQWMALEPSPALPFSAAAERNKEPILQALQRWLPENARALELASGTGQHAAHFAAQQPRWSWQPSEADAGLLPAIAARCAGLVNVLPPLSLDLLAPAWPALPIELDVVFAANMLHISPAATWPALLRLASDQLGRKGLLIVYGPFEIEGEPLAPSNAAFDADLRARDARWGLRRLGELTREAAVHGLELAERVAMPANNFTLIWRRSAQHRG